MGKRIVEADKLRTESRKRLENGIYRLGVRRFRQIRRGPIALILRTFHRGSMVQKRVPRLGRLRRNEKDRKPLRLRIGPGDVRREIIRCRVMRNI